MEECPICYYKMDTGVGSHLLICCNHEICHSCLALLKKPVCPFCRKPVTDSPYQYSQSLPNHSPIFLLSEYDYSIDPYSQETSRSLRRQMKRLRKIQERERRNAYNRVLNQTLAASYQMTKEAQKRLITQQIDEDILFV